ncbi:AAA family ATPase [Candidatus Amarolinea dominans]|uniref:AAA family ATPase n=1 Tax=Candidatus Amarolinea dominans TaxID=3140696 RepID=UPI0031CCCADC
MRDATFLRRVVLQNYKSIAGCDVQLGPLTFLVGPNGAGKSNFLDALRFVADALRTSWTTRCATAAESMTYAVRAAIIPRTSECGCTSFCAMERAAIMLFGLDHYEAADMRFNRRSVPSTNRAGVTSASRTENWLPAA